jgi:hypothetical protein
MHHATWRIFGESESAQADTLEKLNRLIFGRAYAPTPDSVFYWTTTTNAETNKES